MSGGISAQNHIMKAKENIYVNADRSKVVPGDSEEAAFLLIAKDGEVRPELAEKYGIKNDQPKADDQPKANKKKKPAENKKK